jgi:hypothetical protein
MIQPNTTLIDRIESIKAANELKAAKASDEAKHQELVDGHYNTQKTVLESFKLFVDYLEHHTSKAEIVNHLQEIGTPDALKVVTAVNELHETLKTHENTDLTEVTKLLHDLLQETQAIPKENTPVNIPDTVTVANQADYSKDLKNLLDAVKAIKLVAEAPVVNLPAPQVQVEAPDLTPLQSATKAVEKAVKSLVFPEYKTDNTGVEKLLKKTNKLLDELLDKPTGGGGGGGGRATPYQDAAGIPEFVELNNHAVPVAQQVFTERFATAGGYDYVGEAPVGSNEAAAVWTISRYNAAEGKVAQHVAWSNYLTETYL